MAYSILHSDGSTFLLLADQQINADACSLALVGRGAPNFGQAIATNFLALLESFASDSAPPLPVEGQIWWDRSGQTLRVMDANGHWESVGFGGKTSGADGAVSTVSLSAQGLGGVNDTVGFININQAAPANSRRYRTKVLDDGSWALQSLDDLGVVKATPLLISSTGGLSINVPVSGTASLANRLSTAVGIGLSGDASGSVAFDGSAAVAIPVTLATIGSQGTYLSVVVDAKGRVVSGGGVAAGSIALAGEVISQNTPSPLLTINTYLGANGVQAGTYTAVTVDNTGRVSFGDALRMTGDVSGTASGAGLVASLAAMPGLSAGTYSSVAVDGKGRVTQGFTAGQAAAAQSLGFTPVNRAGDTMTGGLAISPRSGAATLQIDAASGNAKTLAYTTAMSPRFSIGLTAEAELGGQGGSNFALVPFTDSGVALAAALTVIRSSGAVLVPGSLTVGGTLTATLAGGATTATKLATARSLILTGDAGGSATFDGSANTTITVALASQPGLSAGTYNAVTVSAKGLVTGGSPASAVPAAGAVGSYTIYAGSLLATDGTPAKLGSTVAASSINMGNAGTWACSGSILVGGGNVFILVRVS